MLVVDTSALLAVVFNEASAIWVLEQLDDSKDEALMSTVNLAEALIIVRSRHKKETAAEVAERQVLASEFKFIPPSVEHARLAAMARIKFPLNLGDCFAYALSSEQNCPILTIDRDFRSCGRPLLLFPQS
jgi:uncharacterized protein with PIN domain